ncbi:MAG: LPS export ABC transporter permease LptG [Alcanivoracaceae bacterium]|nr:LPS export ABC transporter permease LptG [Alcanivoracaceae bacterium]
MMFTTLNNYIFRSISLGIALAIMMFLTLDLLIGFIQQINAVGKGDFTIGSALFYTMLTIPNRIFDNFPVSCVVGVMIGLGALAASSELVIIQSIGISRLKMAVLTIVVLIIWLIPMSLMGEFVVPVAKLTAESFRHAKINKDVGLGANSGIWIRDGNIIFNAKPIGGVYDAPNKNIIMNDVTVYELDDNLQVIKVSKAEKAIHKGKSWEMYKLEVTEFVESGVNTRFLKEQIWPSRIEPEILSIIDSRPKYLSIRDILKYKKFQKHKENIPIKYDIALWSKFSYPLLVIATALTGLPFLFGLLRSGGFGQRLLIGVVLGIVLYLVNRTLLNVGEVFHVHPIIVTTLPSTVILFVVLLYLRLQKKK